MAWGPRSLINASRSCIVTGSLVNGGWRALVWWEDMVLGQWRPPVQPGSDPKYLLGVTSYGRPRGRNLSERQQTSIDGVNNPKPVAHSHHRATYRS